LKAAHAVNQVGKSCVIHAKRKSHEQSPPHLEVYEHVEEYQEKRRHRECRHDAHNCGQMGKLILYLAKKNAATDFANA